jgi:hypothetical protein
MSQTTHPPDKLDELLSDFFKAKLPHPWPAAPVPTPAEPSGLVAARSAPANADRGNRARVTLAASVALLLGACWFLLGEGQPDPRAATRPGGGPRVLDQGTAKMPEAFDKVRADKAKQSEDPMKGYRPPPIKLP